MQRTNGLLNTGSDPGNPSIATFLAFGQGLVRSAFTLVVHAPALSDEPDFTLPIHIAAISPHVTAGITLVEYALKVQGVVLAGSADHHLPNQLVTLINAG
nr:hypothetical protein [Chitinimonas sp. BJB300]